jgi:hypothetical protein
MACADCERRRQRLKQLAGTIVFGAKRVLAGQLPARDDFVGEIGADWPEADETVKKDASQSRA